MARPPYWFASNRMATRKRPPALTETPLESALAAIGLLLLIGGLWLALLLIDAGHEPTERCFQTSLTETNYCRSQADWGAK